MNKIGTQYKTQARTWFVEHALPLWTTRGIAANGSFVENLSREGHALQDPQRALVQCRQIYVLVESVRMGVLTEDKVKEPLRKTMDFFFKTYLRPNGAVIHSTDVHGQPKNEGFELYTQAFALFGMAQAYEILRDTQIKTHAKKLLNYLQTERRAPHGGFTEIQKGETLYQSNPHMHLFEAVLAWVNVDDDPAWKQVAQSLYELCTTKFIDKTSGALCEHFDEFWTPQRVNDSFIFEPGHQFEWAWLLLQYEKLMGISVGTLPQQLFTMGEHHGVDKKTGITWDEIWSNLEPKKKTARLWPHCERMKAALEVGLKAPAQEQAAFAKSADQAMASLFKYFEKMPAGLWEDVLQEDGTFVPQAVKASSFYHITNALSEYFAKRALLRDE